MSDKKVEKEIKEAEEEKKPTGVDLTEVALGDLISIFEFVISDDNRVFGDNKDGKAMVRAKRAAIVAELYDRIYGCDPLSLGRKSDVVNGKLIEKLSKI